MMIEDEVPIPMHLMYKFWGSLFGSTPDNFNFPVVELNERPTQPITCIDIVASIKDLKDGAPGVDKMTKRTAARMDTASLKNRFNLYLGIATTPSCFKVGITALIPKVPGTNDPSKFRPITMSPILSRIFHKILARRLEKTLDMDGRQKAFLRRDGVAENFTILRNMITDSKRVTPENSFSIRLESLRLCITRGNTSLSATLWCRVRYLEIYPKSIHRQHNVSKNQGRHL